MMSNSASRNGAATLFFTTLRAGARADDAVAFLDGLNAADIDADRGIELERAAAGGGFGVAEHDADFFADLVDENEAGARLGDDAGEFAQRLRHQARLQAHRADRPCRLRVRPWERGRRRSRRR